ncbi:MAG: KpsF/GutQ family sugar-phosphate isomerase [Neisseriaceae bacterium]|nr:KpsF/GutQ family sugar-phosphate isomerase [Neisseriaceae bacterium]
MTQTVSHADEARQVLNAESRVLDALAHHLDDTVFNRAVEMLLACRGRVVVTGMGKSGHIGHKIAATMASTGTPAFFVHPGEAAHGDLGMILSDDIVLALSHSGESEEVIRILPAIHHKGSPIIAITGNLKSTLAEKADIVLHTQVDREACPLNLAPTASTTAALAMGDALAMALSTAKNFTQKEFALSHPAGRLGKRLLMKVSDVMRTGDDLPVLSPDTPLRQAIIEMSHKKMGMVLAADNQQQLLGIFTDGDLRRVFEKYDDISHLTLADIITKNPKTTTANTSAQDALDLMLQHNISVLAVVDSVSGCLKGAVSLYDIQQEGL